MCPNDHFIARPIATPEITAESYEVSPSLLNLITREVNDKISSMLELLERNLEESVK